MDPTSLNLRLLWWCREYGISRYPYLTDAFQISQRNIYNKFLLKIVYITYTPLSNISLIPPSFFGLGWRFHKMNAEITYALTAHCSIRIADVIFTGVF
jgi:hypothetical protein